MTETTAEPRNVGRKKSETPSGLKAIKVEGSIYTDLKLISVYQGRDISKVASDLLREVAAKLRKAEQAKRESQS